MHDLFSMTVEKVDIIMINDDDFDSLLTFKGKGGVDLLAGRQTQTRGDY